MDQAKNCFNNFRRPRGKPKLLLSITIRAIGDAFATEADAQPAIGPEGADHSLMGNNDGPVG
ncbi:hypothetical protein ARTHRO9V_90103 [Arthrobacter sp. 9V]|nr:hypothetical protein ARTHRO9V_90103 [Arthrobacter sp. 9V]